MKSQGIALVESLDTYPVSANLLPLNSLPSNRQLPPQALEAALGQVHKRPVQFLLKLVLYLRDLPHSRLSTTCTSHLHFLARAHPHIAVLVVVHINLDGAAQGACGRVEGVCGAPAAVPEVLRGVLVRYEQDGDTVVGIGGINAHCRGWEVLGGGCGEGFLKGANLVCVGGFERMLLSGRSFLRILSMMFPSKGITSGLPV